MRAFCSSLRSSQTALKINFNSAGHFFNRNDSPFCQRKGALAPFKISQSLFGLVHLNMSGELFAHYLAASRDTREHQISDNSNKTYSAYLRSYEKTMREEFQMEPYPLNEEKICAFLMLKKDQGRTFQTLLLFINTFSWFFRQHDLDNIVLTILFKTFKNGLRRMMLGGTAPNQKLPFPAEFFPLLHEHMNLQARDDRLLYFLMALAFNFLCALVKFYNCV